MPAPFPKLHAYAVAVTSVLVMIAVRSALDPLLRDIAPVILFMIPVAFSAWFGGLGPGLVATVFGGTAGIAIFSSVTRQPTTDHSHLFNWAARGLSFFIVGLSISLLAEFAERSRQRAIASGLRAQKSEAELAEARRRSDAALLAAEMGTFTWDINADRLYGDANFARIFAVALDADGAAPIASYVDTLHPADRDRVLAAVRANVDTDADYATEYRVVVGDRERWIMARGGTERDAAGTPLRFSGVVVDVTELHRMGEAFNSQQERYRTLFDSIDDGFCIIEMVYDDHGKAVDYRFLEVNPTFETQTGLVGMSGKRIREIVPDHDEHWFEIYGRVATTGEPTRLINEAKALHRWFDVYACRVGGEGSRQVAVIFHDITAKRNAELERERLLASETQARHAAEQASRMKDDFLATVSHELRTPLTAITGWAALLQQLKTEPKMLDEGLAVIARNAAVQAQLIEDILDVSRITSGKLRLNVRNIDLRQPINAAIDTVANAAINKGVAISTVGFDHPGDLAGDPERLQQVFWNLLANAIKFTDTGGRITVTLTQPDHVRVVEVRDSGRGIDAEFLPFVFDRFRQADMSSTRRQGGLGLGLSIVRHLVEMHGGTVRCDSGGPGHGSVFVVELPYTAVAPEPVMPQSPAGHRNEADNAATALHGARVLVLDDEPDARRVIEVTLARHGAMVLPVGTVAAAVHALTTDSAIDCVISDIGLPEEDGYAFARRLLDLESRQLIRRVPRAALTAYTRESDRRAVLAAGFDHFLAKPVNAGDLLHTVESMLRQR